MKRMTACLLLASLAGMLIGCSVGTPAATTPAPADTIALSLDEMSIAPATVTVPRGQSVTFVVTNVGVIDHEVYLGDEAAQAAHEEEMAEMGVEPHEHSNSVIVAPGETRELEFTFSATGAWLAGCHLPGHYAAGMVATVNVVD